MVDPEPELSEPDPEDPEPDEPEEPDPEEPDPEEEPSSPVEVTSASPLDELVPPAVPLSVSTTPPEVPPDVPGTPYMGSSVVVHPTNSPSESAPAVRRIRDGALQWGHGSPTRIGRWHAEQDVNRMH